MEGDHESHTFSLHSSQFVRGHSKGTKPCTETLWGDTLPRAHSHGHGHLPQSTCSSRKAQSASGDLGFHTLQYQHKASTGQHSDSPSGILHLVRSVQRLFNKSHSLEDSETQWTVETHGMRGRDPIQQPPRGRRRSRSHERNKQRDSSYLQHWGSNHNVAGDCGDSGNPSQDVHMVARDWTHMAQTIQRAEGPQVGCPACAGHNTVRFNQVGQQQGHEWPERERTEKSSQCLQVPWGAERQLKGMRMRTMAEEDSGDSNIRHRFQHRDVIEGSHSIEHPQWRTRCFCKHCTSRAFNSHHVPNHPACDLTDVALLRRTEANHKQQLTRSQVGGDLRRQFQEVCASVLGESQAVEALDLPGSFRPRSHSYLRAIQAGVSRDDHCLALLPQTSLQCRGRCRTVHRQRESNTAPPPLPPRMSHLRGRAQCSPATGGQAVPQRRCQEGVERLQGLSCSHYYGNHPPWCQEGEGGFLWRADHRGSTGSSQNRSTPIITVQQVDGTETVYDPERDRLRDVQSIGIQVDTERSLQTETVREELQSTPPLALCHTPSARLHGDVYLQLLSSQVERLESWCCSLEQEAEEKLLPEDALQQIHSTVDSTRLLLVEKVQSFFRACRMRMEPADLADMWDLLQLSLEEIRFRLHELQQLRQNNWRPTLEMVAPRLPPPLPKKPSNMVGRRQEMEDRRQRQSSATESADGTEVHVPEGQTRF